MEMAITELHFHTRFSDLDNQSSSLGHEKAKASAVIILQSSQSFLIRYGILLRQDVL